MCIAARDWAWAQALPPTAKYVLLALAERADDAGLCWPSLAQLSAMTHLSVRSLRRVLRALAASGHLEVTVGAGRTRSRYQLALNPRFEPEEERGHTAPSERTHGPGREDTPSPQRGQGDRSGGTQCLLREDIRSPQRGHSVLSQHYSVEISSPLTVIKPTEGDSPPCSPPSRAARGDGGDGVAHGVTRGPPVHRPPRAAVGAANPVTEAVTRLPAAAPSLRRPPGAPAPRRRLATRIAPDWRPSERVYRWGEERGLASCWIDQQVTEFIAYWSDCGKPMKSWDATFLNRLQRILERPRNEPRHRPARPSAAERMRLAGLAYLASLGLRPAPDDALDPDGGDLSAPLVGDAGRAG